MTNNPQEPFGPGPTGLYRDPQNGKIAGVCAGLAAYFGVRVGRLRLAVIILAFFFFLPVLVAYIVLAVLLNPMPAQLYRDSEDAAFWRSVVRRPADTVNGLARRFRELDQRLARLERQVTSPDEVLRAQFRQL